MNSQRRNGLPHMIAALGSITILTLLPLFFYVVLMIATNDVGGSLNLFLIPCSNLFIASLFTLVIFFPLSKLLDRRFQKQNHENQTRAKSILFSGVLLLFILIAVVIGFALAIGSILGERDPESVLVGLFRFLFLGGIPFLMGGATYWFLLQVSRKILLHFEVYKHEDEKAG